MSSKTKARKKPTTPPTPWDAGPDTVMQKAGTAIRPVPEDKNGMKRKVRLDPIDRAPLLAALSRRQRSAAQEITEAWEATGKGPPAIKEIFVDSTPNPTASIATHIDRMSRFHRVWGCVPSGDASRVVAHVCCDRRAIRDGLARNSTETGMWVAQLQVALDLVANEMGV